MTEAQRQSSVQTYLDTLYQNTDGYVYLATKNPETADWAKHYFRWPDERHLVEEFIVAEGSRTNVYIAPAIFKDDSSSKKHNVKGSHVYWVEFDGAVPDSETLAMHGIPEPSMRVQSSEPGREHWYWRCSEFNQDIANIDGVNRGITYALGADPSGWDADQVLRPPATINFKRNKRVEFIGTADSVVSPSDLESLAADHAIEQTDFQESDLTALQYIVGRYQFTKYELDRMAPAQEGDRSDRIYEIAMFCAEKGMSDAELFSVIYWADKRVGKFADRTDKLRQYNNLVARARAKYPADHTVPTGLLFRSATDIHDDPVELEWQIEGLLQRSGIMLLAGDPGVGKSQLSMQALMAMARGEEKFLDFPIQNGRRGAYVSMEMPTVELKSLFRTMLKSLPQEARQAMDQNLFWLDRGEQMNFRDEKVRKLLEDAISTYGLELVVFDSFSKMGIHKMQDEEQILEMMGWFDYVRNRYNCSLWIIHHNRKSSGDRKADTLDDVYGSRFITAGATSVVVMSKTKTQNNLKLKFEKIRTAPERKPMLITRKTHDLSFMVNGMSALLENVDNLEGSMADEPAFEEPEDIPEVPQDEPYSPSNLDM